MDAEELGKYVHDKVVGGPGCLPVKFVITYDEQSKDLALRAIGTIHDIAKKHGVEKLVEVTHEQWDPDEER
jgi:ABC-type sugar transport system substrate-binding protein